jgi:hypothetical protein
MGGESIAFEEDNRDFILACFFLPGDLVEILAKKNMLSPLLHFYYRNFNTTMAKSTAITSYDPYMSIAFPV